MSAARELLQWLIGRVVASDREKGDALALLDQAHPAGAADGTPEREAPGEAPDTGPDVPPEGGTQ